MKSPPFPPEDWSPQQALAVLDLLDALQQAIWKRYETVLVPLCIEQLHQDCGIDGKKEEELDDDIPF